MEAALPWLLTHGWPLIVGVLLLSAFGSPIPEDVPLLAAGVLSAHGSLSVGAASMALWAAVMTRDLLIFGLGRHYGPRLIRRPWVQRVFTPARLGKAEAAIRTRGAAVVAVGRFLPGIRGTVFFAAGLSGVRPRTFLLVDGVAAAVSVPVFVALGAALGRNLDQLWAAAVKLKGSMLVAVAAALVLAVLWRLTHRVKLLTPPA